SACKRDCLFGSTWLSLDRRLFEAGKIVTLTMKKPFANIVDDCFNALAEKYGFNRKTEINVGQTYSIEYGSDSFVIRLEKYRHEFYASLYKTGTSDMEINLNNLLAYLHLDSSIVPV